MYIIIGTSTGATSCDHCGRAIKNIVSVKDTHTGDILHVGSTCIYELMKLTESFNDRVQKELKKYNKIKAEYELYKDEEVTLQRLIVEGQLNEMHWDDDKHQNVQNDIVYLKHIAWFLHHNKENKLREQIEVLNKLSKKGLIQIEL